MNAILSTILLAALSTTGVPGEPNWTFQPSESISAARNEATELAKRAESESDPLVAVDLHLAAANCLLGAPLAPMASRSFLGIPQPEDATLVHALLDETRKQLELADAALARAAEGREPADVPLARRVERIDSVRAFVHAAGALWETSADVSTARDDALRDATLELAILMEDRRANVASTARLWRAHLFDARGDRARALDLLPTELEPPVGDPSVSMYMRLMRSRMSLKEHGSYPAALALTVRLENSVADWFPAPQDAAAARRTVAFVRRGMMRDWGVALAAAGDADRSTWCDRAVGRIDQEHFKAQDSSALLPLAWAAPPMIDLPTAHPVELAPPGEDTGEEEDAAPATTNGPPGE